MTEKGSSSKATATGLRSAPTPLSPSVAPDKNQTIVDVIKAPVLMGVTLHDLVTFNKKRTMYCREVDEKNKQPGVAIQKASYLSTVDPSVLDLFIQRDYIKKEKVEDVTETDITECIAKLTKRDSEQFELPDIDKAIRKVNIRMSVPGSTPRIDSLVLDYKRALEAAGYSSFPTECPKLAITHIFDRLKPPMLKEMMSDEFEKQAKKDLRKKDFKVFISELVRIAAIVEKTAMRRPAHQNFEQGSSSRDVPKPQFKTGKVKSAAKSATDEEPQPSQKSPSQKRTREMPFCLYSECKKTQERHFVWRCPHLKNDKSAQKRLLDEYRKDKGRDSKKPRGIRTMTTEEIDNHSTLFNAKFVEVVEVQAFADNCADDNLLPRNVLAAIQAADARIQTTELSKPVSFDLAIEIPEGKNATKVICEKTVRLDVELSIRHGSKLLLRGVDWLVSTQHAKHVLLGRPLLEALGLKTKDILEAAADHYNGIVNVSELLREDPDPKDGTLAKVIKENGIYHSHHGDDFISEDDDIYIDLGDDKPGACELALSKKVAEARVNGLAIKHLNLLKNVISEFKDIFRVRLGKEKPARVEPMVVQLKSGIKPIIAKARRYKEDQRIFLNKYIAQLERMGYLKKNPHAKWASPPLLVPKDSPAKFRMTVDLRGVNSATVQTVWPMPHVDSEVFDFRHSNCFATLDFVSGYWQLPLAPESQEVHSIITPQGIYSPTRTQQGATNSVANFQSKVEPLFAPMRKTLKAWLDDFIVHAASEDEFLVVLRQFFEICREHGLFISATKSVFYTTTVRWCGRLISKSGVVMDPRRASALENISLPDTAGELCQFVNCLRWMSSSIPQFAERCAPLDSILEKAYSQAGSRKKRAIQRIKLQNLSWGAEHTEAFKSLQNTLRSSVLMKFPNKQKRICIYTDASDKFWSSVITQVSPEELTRPVHTQNHEPLAFLGSAFSGSQLNWSTFEKEGYAIYQAFKKMDYMLYSEYPVHLFTDHRNLLFVFSPISLQPALGRHVVNKVQRWALYLSQFQYVIEHVAGDQNLFADILTRWLKGYRSENNYSSKMCKLFRAEDTIKSPSNDEFIWPDQRRFLISQNRSRSSSKKELIYDKLDGIWKQNGRIWVPDEDHDLQLKIIVVSHFSLGGHRGVDATESIVKENFYWSDMRMDITQFIKGCIHCLVTRSGMYIPRPLGTQLHGTRPNEVVHADFLYMGPGVENMKYILLIRDDFSSFVYLGAAPKATSTFAAECLSKWISLFGSMTWFVTDQGSHFKNELHHNLVRMFRIRKHFTTAYSPWSNGTVERVNSEILRSCKALLSEWHLAPQDWPTVVDCIQSILNQSPLKRLGPKKDGCYRSPLEVFTGIQPSRPLLNSLPIRQFKEISSDDELKTVQLLKIESIQQALENMHKDVNERITSARAKQILKHNAKTNVLPANFTIGDFVLVRRAQLSKGHKLQFVWRGPRRITKAISKWTFEVTGLLDKKVEVVHARRLLWYRADRDETEVDSAILEYATHSETDYEQIEKLLDIVNNNGEFSILVEWQGLPDDVYRTYEPLLQLAEDVPELLQKYLQSPGKSSLKQKATRLLSEPNR